MRTLYILPSTTTHPFIIYLFSFISLLLNITRKVGNSLKLKINPQLTKIISIVQVINYNRLYPPCNMGYIN